jgi:hypothetical protein
MPRIALVVGARALLLALAVWDLALAQPPADPPLPGAAEIEKAIQRNIERVRAEEGRDRPIPEDNEIVMTPGMTIRATTSTGTITITAGKGLQRSYTWEGSTRSVEMWPRTKRWDGSLGLYFPGPGYHWKEHDGIARCVVDEGQQHFKSVHEAEQWVDERRYMDFVHRNDGLVVGWDKTPSRKQLGVEVWQIYVNGKKPTELKGSEDDKLIVNSHR